MEMDESHVSNSEDYKIDRLSELPDSILLEILSFLEMRYVVRTTLLSKRWKDLWTTVPRLNLWVQNRSFICGALAKWKGEKIHYFALAFDDDDDDDDEDEDEEDEDEDIPPSDILDSWLLIPIDKQVEELCVCLGPHLQYCAPQCLYSCSSITKLSLTFCNLKIGENVDVQWNQLKSLTIEHSNNLSEDAMNRILCGAPLLEKLMLWSLDINENLNIRSTSLKTLQISRADRSFYKTQVMAEGMLTIWAPNLLSLEISARVYGTCLLDVPSLTTAIIGFQDSFIRGIDEGIDEEDLPPLQMFDQVFRSLRHVENLTLSDLSFQLLLEMKENHMVARFSNTKFLRLYAPETEGMVDVIGMFPDLMNLVVELDEDGYHTLDGESCAAMVDECNSLASKMTFSNTSLLQLKTIEITWSICDATIIPMVEILLANAHMLEKMVLRLRGGAANHNIFTLAKKKVLSMPRSSSIAQVIIHKKW